MSTKETVVMAVDNLWEDDMDGLYQTLATRAHAQEEGEALDKLEQYDVSDFDLPPLPGEEEGGPEFTALITKIGKRWWDKLEPKLYDLLCNKENPDHDKFMGALGDGAKMLAVALAPALVSGVGALPAVAVVIATIAAKKIFDSGLESTCEIWKESLEKEDEPEGKE
jgi:hypothetical protein